MFISFILLFCTINLRAMEGIDHLKGVPPNSALCWAVHKNMTVEKNYDEMLSLLADGADPNGADETGLSPLERAESKPAIMALLIFGADPKMCKKINPLMPVFMYYSSMKKYRKPSYVSDENWFKEELECLKMLLDAGADVHQDWAQSHNIFFVADHQSVNIAETKSIIKLLIQYGANPLLPPGTWTKKSVLEFLACPEFASKYRELCTFIRHEFYYPRARQFLIAWYKEEGSPIATLPLELVHKIGKMIMSDTPKTSY